MAEHGDSDSQCRENPAITPLEPHRDYLGWTRRDATLVMEAIISALRLD
jgi:hypothetical protein